MGKLSPYELLSRVWNECTFDEILEFGLSNGYIGSESIINAASEYSDPNKEYSDDEVKDIVKDADISIVMDALKEKYFADDIIDELDTNEILDTIGWDDVYDHFEFDFKDKEEEKYNEGHEEGFEEGYEEAIKNSQNSEINPIKDGTIDDKWRYLCDTFDLTYYDNIGLYNKILELIKLLNKSTYKDRNDKPWGELE